MAVTIGLGGLSGRPLAAVAVGYTRGRGWGAIRGLSGVGVTVAHTKELSAEPKKGPGPGPVLDSEYRINLRVFTCFPVSLYLLKLKPTQTLRSAQWRKNTRNHISMHVNRCLSSLFSYCSGGSTSKELKVRSF